MNRGTSTLKRNGFARKPGVFSSLMGKPNAKRAGIKRKVRKVTPLNEKVYLDRVAAIGCILCKRLELGWTAPQIHHAREGEGGAQRAPNWLAIPLCEPHHTGSHGIHGDRLALLPLKADEMDLLAWTIEELNK